MESAASLSSVSRRRDGIARKSVRAVLLRGATVLLSTLSGVVIARVLGAEGRGLFAMMESARSIGQNVGAAGYDSAITHLAARAPENIGLLARLAFRKAVTAGIPVGVLAFVVLGGAYGGESFLDPWESLLTAASIPLGIGFLFAGALVLGLRQYQLFYLTRAAQRFGVLLGLCGLAVAGFLTPLTAWGIEICCLLLGLCYFVTHIRRNRTNSPVVAEDPGLSGLGRKLYAVEFSNLALLTADVFLIRHLISAEATGIYAVAQKPLELMLFVTMTAAQILTPHLSSGVLRERMRSWFLRFLTNSVLIVTLVAVALMAVIPWLVPVVYGNEFAPAVPVARLFCLSAIPASACFLMKSFLISAGRSGSMMPVWLAGVGVKFLLIVIASGHLGVEVFAWSVISAYTVIALGQGLLIHGGHRRLPL